MSHNLSQMSFLTSHNNKEKQIIDIPPPSEKLLFSLRNLGYDMINDRYIFSISKQILP